MQNATKPLVRDNLLMSPFFSKSCCQERCTKQVIHFGACNHRRHPETDFAARLIVSFVFNRSSRLVRFSPVACFSMCSFLRHICFCPTLQDRMRVKKNPVFYARVGYGEIGEEIFILDGWCVSFIKISPAGEPKM